MVLMVTVVVEGVVMVVLFAVVLLVVVEMAVLFVICVLLLTGVLIAFFACVQILPDCGDFSEGGVGVECGGISACGSLCS